MSLAFSAEFDDEICQPFAAVYGLKKLAGESGSPGNDPLVHLRRSTTRINRCGLGTTPACHFDLKHSRTSPTNEVQVEGRVDSEMGKICPQAFRYPLRTISI